LDQRATDAVAELNAERKQLVREEMTKREKDGRAQTAKLTYWPVRIKLPEAVAEDCREKYKEAGAVPPRKAGFRRGRQAPRSGST